jgi:DNA-binding CsgD family transcriptional regulator
MKRLKVLKMMAREVFRPLHQSNQGICVLNWAFEKIYENAKAKKIFANKCPELFLQIKAICQTAVNLRDAVSNPMINQSGILRYPTGTIVFSCLSFGKGDQTCIYIIFDYEPLMETSITDLALTPREKEVVQAMVMGKTNKEISELLCIGLETVKSHIRNLFAKTGASSRVELIGRVLRHSSTPRIL